MNEHQGKFSENLKLSRNVIAYDTNIIRIEQLNKGNDVTKELSSFEIDAANSVVFTTDKAKLENSDVFISTVPTPIDHDKKPDLAPLVKASKAIGSILKIGDIVIYESTVYPGATEEICVPILEEQSGLIFNNDFFCGYSPERINPGDKKHSVDKIIKVVSGSNEATASIVGKIYKNIIKAGVFYAKSIEVAETAKAIENAQRDINIAFINEIALLCKKLNISIYDVLDAAKTKWNFLPFYPGLVGGHCIGVDPYYLAHIAKKLDVDTEVILSGRRLNDNMTEIIYNMIQKNIPKNSRVLQIGISFKENVPDIRNSKAAELAKIFIKNKYNIEIYDPIVNKEDVEENYNIKLSEIFGQYDSVIIAVSHNFLRNNKNITNCIKEKANIFDITGKYKTLFNGEKFKYWSL